MQTEQASQVTFIVPREDGNPQKETIVPVTIHAMDHVCLGCKRQFSIVVSWKGHGKLAIASHRRSTTREPDSATSAGLLVLDSIPPSSSTSQTPEKPSWFYIGQNVKKKL